MCPLIIRRAEETARGRGDALDTGGGRDDPLAGRHVNRLRDLVTIGELIPLDVHFELICSPGGFWNVRSVFPEE